MILFESFKRKIFWFGLLLSIIQVSKSYSPPNDSIDIEDFLQVEADIISKIQNYLIQERERLDHLITHLHSWKKWRNSNINQEVEYISIPQNIFHLFKILSMDFKKLEMIMTENIRNDWGLDDIQPPTNSHLDHIVLSLINLQYQYGLKSEDMMNGILRDYRLNLSLSLDSCFFIGKTCAEYNNHECAIDWLKTCLDSSSDEEFDFQVDKQIYPCYIFLNQTENARDHLSVHKLIDVDIFTLEAYRICRENHTNPTHSNLKCRYNHENSPFLKIAPLKEEELNDYPKVLLYKDVVYDSEINDIKVEAMKTMGVSQVTSTDGGNNLKGFNLRLSETAFVNNKLSFLPQLARRMEDISDLSMNSSEWWQVLNYAPGGFYIMHSDFLPVNSSSVKNMGNRLSTMLFYFNEVPLGGETVFPRLGISVKPTKGLALVWSNVHPNGSENILLEHTACPVIIGEKWAFTQWMRWLNQKCLKKTYQYDPNIITRNTN